MPVSAEGRFEHQKRNQTATSQWPFGFVFGVQIDYTCRLESVPSNNEKVVLAQMVNFGMTSFVDSPYEDSQKPFLDFGFSIEVSYGDEKNRLWISRYLFENLKVLLCHMYFFLKTNSRTTIFN